MAARRYDIDFNLGEVDSAFSANLSNSAPFSCKSIENMYWKNKRLVVRPSTELIGTIPLVDDDVIGQSIISSQRKWLFVPILNKATLDITLYIFTGLKVQTARKTLKTWDAAHTISLGKLSDVATELRLLEVSSKLFKENTCVGISGILIFGLEKLVYIDDDLTLKDFKIRIGQTATVAGTLVDFLKPICGLLFQTKLFICGVGASLSGGTLPTNPPVLFYSSSINSIDNFRLVGSTTSVPPLTDNSCAFDLNLMLSPDEKILNMNSFMNRISLNTTQAVYSISSGSAESDFIGQNTNQKTKVSNVGCFDSDIILFETMLVYASFHGMRQQSQGGMLTQYFQLIDQKSLVYNNLIPKKLVQDPTRATILTTLDDGTIRSFFWGRTTDANASVPLCMTTYYKSDVRPAIGVARTPSAVFDAIIVKNEECDLAYVLQEMDESSGRDLTREWKPEVIITNSSGLTFTASFVGFRTTLGLKGIWFLVGDFWHYALRNGDDSDQYTVVSRRLEDTMYVPSDGVYPVFPDTVQIANQLSEFDLSTNTPNEDGYEGGRIDVTIDGMTHDLKFKKNEHFILDFDGGFCIADRQGFYGSVKVQISVWGKYPGVTWYSGASYSGAPQLATDYIIISNEKLKQQFVIMYEHAGLISMEGEESSYFSFKFPSGSTTSDNVNEVWLINRQLGKDASIDQIFFLSE